MPSQVVGSLSILASPSSPGCLSVPPAAPFSLRSQLSRAVPSRTPYVVVWDVMITSGVSFSRQLTTVKRQRDPVRRDLAAVIAELHKDRDESYELRSALVAVCDSSQVECSSTLELEFKCYSVLAQLPSSGEVDDYTS